MSLSITDPASRTSVTHGVDKENIPPAPTRTVSESPHRAQSVSIQSLGVRRKRSEDEGDILQRGPRKRASTTDPLVRHGRHFGRALRSFCRVLPLLRQGLSFSNQIELGRLSEDDMTQTELKEWNIYQQLLLLSPKLEERLCTGSEQDMFHVADLITKGASASRSDDTRQLKSVVVDWITPQGGILVPPLQRNVKSDRGFHHPKTGELLCPATMDWTDATVRDELRSGQRVPVGDQWPLFLYQNYKFDREDPWAGLLRSHLLVKAFKHVFTSPSSVEKGVDICATRSSNSKIHGMKSVTVASIAYIATQVRFALSSVPTFCRSDTITDSERFYNSVIDFLEDPEEDLEVKKLLAWWNRQVFPVQEQFNSKTVSKDSVFAIIKERRRLEHLGAQLIEPPPQL